MTTEVFFSYSHKDEDLRDKLANQLKILERLGLINAWYDRDISAGTEWAGKIDEHLNSAQVILLLVSPDFLASEYCWDIEVKVAMQRHEAGEARVIPVILRPAAYWTEAPFGKLQALPTDAKPVTTWNNIDQALENVVKGIRKAVNEVAVISSQPKTETFSQPKIININHRHLTQQLKELQQDYNHQTEEIEFLSQSEKIEDLSPKERFRLNKQIAEAKAKREEVAQKIEAIENQLN